MSSYPLESELNINELPRHIDLKDNPEVAINITNITDLEQEQTIHRKIRLGFVRKVYGILSIQLLITVILCGLTFKDEVKVFMIESSGFLWLSMSLSIILSIPLLCFRSIARKVPTNYLILFFWTLSEAYMVACVCALYDGKTVIMAAVATLVVTLSITLYAFYTKEDFTFLGGFLFCGVAMLLLLTIFSFFLPFLHTVICIFGVFLYSLYLLFDTQLILGKVGNEFSLDDYVLAALCIYIDILQIFLYLLEIISRFNN